MTRSVIVDKLRKALQSDIATEEKVVYILVQVRKLVHLEGELAIPPDLTDFKAYEIATESGWSPGEPSNKKWYPYRTLHFYCSWALHVNMSKNVARRILKCFDEAHPLLAKGMELHELPDLLGREIENIIRLERFEEQMRAVLSSNGLPTKLVDNDWGNFLHIYGGVVQGCPLTLKSDQELKHISSVSVSVETAQKPHEVSGQQYVLYRICWNCHGKDGESGTLFVLMEKRQQ